MKNCIRGVICAGLVAFGWLSEANALLGYTEGKLEVNNQGAAVYTVPIQVPPGINGVEPQLALTYSSLAGNGIAGVGWSLSGISSISRCPGTIAVDGARSGISFSDQKFCWDGRRVVQTSTGTDTLGAYIEYRTEIDTFARIRAYKGASTDTDPEFFIVTTKSGQRLEFGKTANSAQDTRIRPQSLGTLTWAINRIQDRSGNYLTVSYDIATDHSEYHPSKISYTGNTGITPVRFVEFSYETRTDASTRYQVGAKLASNMRLQSITTKFTSDIVRVYTLTYMTESTGAQRSLLQSITECGGAGTSNCYDTALTFTWRDTGTTGFTAADTSVTVQDGKRLDSWNRLVDMNGDGITDLFKVTNRDKGGIFEVAVGDGKGGFLASQVVSKPTQIDSVDCTPWDEYYSLLRPLIVDYKNFVIDKCLTNWGLSTLYSDSRYIRVFDTSNIWLIYLYDALVYPESKPDSGFQQWNELIDVNGDGFLDIVRVVNPNDSTYQDDLEVRLGSSNGFFSQTTSIIPDVITYGPEGLRFWNQLIDINGDGLIDIFQAKSGSNGFAIFLGALDSNNNFTFTASCGYGSTPSCTGTTGEGLSFYTQNYGFRQTNQLADIDGDGILDIFKVVQSNFDWQSSGTSTPPASDVQILFGSVHDGTVLYSSRGLQTQSNIVTPILWTGGRYSGYFNFYNQLVDINGDGILDLVSLSEPAMVTQKDIELWQYNDSATNSQKFSVVYLNGKQQVSGFSISGSTDPWYNTAPSSCTSNSTGSCHFYVLSRKYVNAGRKVAIRVGKGDGIFTQNPVAVNVPISGNTIDAPAGHFDANVVENYILNGVNSYGCTRNAKKSSDEHKRPSNSAIIDVEMSYVCVAPNGLYDEANGISHFGKFVDTDGDGISDLVRINSAGGISVEIGKGDGTFLVDTSPAYIGDTTAELTAWNHISDLTGDTQPDIFVVNSTATPKSGTTYKSNRARPGLLQTITTGIGLVTTLEFGVRKATSFGPAPASASSANVVFVESPEPLPGPHCANASAGRACITPSAYRVVSKEVADGAAINRTFSNRYEYAYKDSTLDFKRGWLGYGEVKETDINKQLVRTDYYSATYPFIGLPIFSLTQSTDIGRYTLCDNSGGMGGGSCTDYIYRKTLGSTRHNWSICTSDAGRPYACEVSVVESSYDLNNYGRRNLATTTSFDGYDTYGNPSKITVRNDHDANVSVTAFANTYKIGSDVIGQLDAQTVTETQSTAIGSRSRRTARNYYASGLLKDATVSDAITDASGTAIADVSNAFNLTLTTAYTYSTVGYPLTKTATGGDAEYDTTGSKISNVSTSRAQSYTYTPTTFNTRQWSQAISQTIGGLTRTETTTFDSYWGSKVQFDDAASIRTGWGQDALGRPQSETQYAQSASAVTTTRTYSTCPANCASGARYLITEAKSNAAGTTLIPLQSQYDALGRVLRRVDPESGGTRNIFVDTLYDAAGRVWKISEPYFSNGTPLWNVHIYDEAGRDSTVTAANGLSVLYGYSGLTTTVTRIGDEAAQSTTYARDSRGQTTSVTDALNNITTYTYGPFGVLSSVKDTKGNTTTLTYDVMGNKLSQNDPDMGLWNYRYNAFGELKWQKDALAQITKFTYDNAGRMSSRIEAPGATNTATTTWAYDHNATQDLGRLQSVTRGQVVESFIYDPATGLANSSTVAINGASYTRTATYDSFGRSDTITYPNSALTLKKAYYDTGALKSVGKLETNGTVSATYWQATAFSARHQVTGETLGNGLTTTRRYNPESGALEGITTGSVQDLDYQYYLSGNLSSRTNRRTSAKESFLYDALDRLVRADTNAPNSRPRIYDYDALGNVLQKSGVGGFTYGAPVPGTFAGPHAATAASYTNLASYTATDVTNVVNTVLGNATNGQDCNKDNAVNVLDVLCMNEIIADRAGRASNSYTYEYDANGNMVKATSNGVQVRGMTYTVFNKPLTVTTPSVTATFGYGPMFERLTKYVQNGTNTQRTTTIGSFYEKVEATTSGVTTTKEKYYVSAAGRLVAMLTIGGGTSTTKYVHTDALGSVDVITDSAGNKVEEQSFDDYGQPRGGTWQDGSVSSITSTTRGYTGHEMDSEFGLINMNARMYDPMLGRFTSPDPTVPSIYNPQALNRYAYALNNPFRYVDPTGYATCDPNDSSCVQSTPDTACRLDGSCVFGNGSSVDAAGNFTTANGGYIPNSKEGTLIGQDYFPRMDTQGVGPNYTAGQVITVIVDSVFFGAATNSANTTNAFLGGNYGDAAMYFMATAGGVVAGGLGVIESGGTLQATGRGVEAVAVAEREAMAVLDVAKGLPTPTVSDPKLGNLVSDLYKGAKGQNPIGTGSTADAIRNELATGLPTHGTFHSQKGEQYTNALNNWLRKNPDASYHDRLVAESLKRDLQNALGRE
ncbi:MAG: RHS repeat-associated core domain-containing protein [Pseudomonadota bacterium]